jgi:hypothetical protein
MKRAALGLCVATAFAASVAAQSQTQTPSTTPQSANPTQTTAAGAAGDITITGCLQKGADGNFTLSNVQQDASATGTSGSTAATPGATSTPGAASTPGATAGAGAGAGAAAASTWALKGGDLAAHVGHRIAVTGKRAMASSSAAGATSTSGAAAGATADPSASRPAATSGSASNMRTLEVSSVKMVSANCQ